MAKHVFPLKNFPTFIYAYVYMFMWVEVRGQHRVTSSIIPGLILRQNLSLNPTGLTDLGGWLVSKSQ